MNTRRVKQGDRIREWRSKWRIWTATRQQRQKHRKEHRKIFWDQWQKQKEKRKNDQKWEWKRDDQIKMEEFEQEVFLKSFKKCWITKNETKCPEKKRILLFKKWSKNKGKWDKRNESILWKQTYFWREKNRLRGIKENEGKWKQKRNKS